MGQDQRLGQVSPNSKKVQNLAHKAMFVSLLYKRIVIIRLANFPHKFLGLDQHLGQVLSSSDNVQHLTVLHGFIEASSFPFYTNL